MGLDPGADGLHHAEVDAEQVVAAHAGLARHTGGNDDHIGAGNIGDVIGALDVGVETFDRAALRDVERLALRQSLCDVIEHDVAHFMLGGEMGQRAADHAGAD